MCIHPDLCGRLPCGGCADTGALRALSAKCESRRGDHRMGSRQTLRRLGRDRPRRRHPLLRRRTASIFRHRRRGEEHLAAPHGEGHRAHPRHDLSLQGVRTGGAIPRKLSRGLRKGCLDACRRSQDKVHHLRPRQTLHVVPHGQRRSRPVGHHHHSVGSRRIRR